jgi:uncharacterized protein
MEDKQTQKTVVRSGGGNRYLLTRRIPQVLLLHPVLHYIIELEDKGVDSAEWIGGLESRSLEIEGNIETSKDELLYYYNYYLFLRENGYFKETAKVKMKDRRFDADTVKRHLASTEQISFEVTDRCNLKCRYCGYGELYYGYDRRSGKDFNIDTAQRFIDYMFDLKGSALNRSVHRKIAISFYGGEPLLNMPFIEEMVRYVKNKKLSHNTLFFSMTTNGTLVNRHMDFLAKNGFSLGISLDGNEDHNKYRVFPDGTPAFNVVWDNIKRLKDKYPDYFEQWVNFQVVLHDRNSRKSVLAFFQDHFNKKPYISSLSLVNINPKKREEFNKILADPSSGWDCETIQEFRENNKKLLDLPVTGELSRLIGAYSGFAFRKYDQLLFPFDSRINVSTGTCAPFQKRVFVTVNGKILPCEKIGQEYYLGTVNQEKVNIDFQEVAEKYNRLYDKLSPMCDRCFNSLHCTKCIFSLNLNDDIPRCNEFLDYETFKKKQSNLFSLIEETPQFYESIMKHGRIH